MNLGVLLINTGTADEPTVEAVSRYVHEFLMDPAIMGMPHFVRRLIVDHICMYRPKRTVVNYQEFWTPDGSPFMIFSKQQREALEQKLSGAMGQPVYVALAMRYGNPSISAGLEELRQAGCETVALLPSFPQQVNVCAGTCLKEAHAQLDKLASEGWNPRRIDIPSFYEQPAYRNALIDSVAEAWSYRPGSKLLVSFHSTLMSDIDAGDPYKDQTEETRDFLADGLGIPLADVLLSYQSRFDNRKWLQPFTAPTVEGLAQEGVKDLCVVCPIFTAECIETAIEIDRDLRKTFLDAAGEGATFTYVPTLNAADGLIEAMAAAVVQRLGVEGGIRHSFSFGSSSGIPGMITRGVHSS